MRTIKLKFSLAKAPKVPSLTVRAHDGHMLSALHSILLA